MRAWGQARLKVGLGELRRVPGWGSPNPDSRSLSLRAGGATDWSRAGVTWSDLYFRKGLLVALRG